MFSKKTFWSVILLLFATPLVCGLCVFLLFAIIWSVFLVLINVFLIVINSNSDFFNLPGKGTNYIKDQFLNISEKLSLAL